MKDRQLFYNYHFLSTSFLCSAWFCVVMLSGSVWFPFFIGSSVKFSKLWSIVSLTKYVFFFSQVVEDEPQTKNSGAVLSILIYPMYIIQARPQYQQQNIFLSLANGTKTCNFEISIFYLVLLLQLVATSTQNWLSHVFWEDCCLAIWCMPMATAAQMLCACFTDCKIIIDNINYCVA